MAGHADDHPEMQKLRQFGVTEEVIGRFQVLCLPENLPTAARPEDLLDSQDSIDLAKRLKETGISCATSYDLTPQAATLHRRGPDLWLGMVWIMDPKAVSGLAAVLITKLKSWSRRITDKKARVHLRLRFRRGLIASEIGYDGDGVILVRMLEGLRRAGGKDRERS